METTTQSDDRTDPHADSLAGRLLIAMPGIDDERFERAVIYVCAHDDQHAMGITLNRPVDGLKMPDLLAKLGVAAQENNREDIVLMGGPVERERGFVLHTDDYRSPAGTLPVAEGLSLTTSREVLAALAADGPPRKAILALGYAGWGAGQLEKEMRQNIWLVGEPSQTLIFGDDHEHKWSLALAGLGISADHLSGQAGRA